LAIDHRHPKPDTDSNPAKTAGPEWLPLINTLLPRPAVRPWLLQQLGRVHPGGLRRHQRATFSATSATSRIARSFTRFTQAIDEIVDGRVYSEIHFRAAINSAPRSADTSPKTAEILRPPSPLTHRARHGPAPEVRPRSAEPCDARARKGRHSCSRWTRLGRATPKSTQVQQQVR
jgi:hypothetical protein